MRLSKHFHITKQKFKPNLSKTSKNMRKKEKRDKAATSKLLLSYYHTKTHTIKRLKVKHFQANKPSTVPS